MEENGPSDPECLYRSKVAETPDEDPRGTDTSDTFEIFGVTLSECQSCGQAMTGTKSMCKKCVGKVPAEVLKELVDEWREKAEAKDSDLVGNVQYQLLHERANDLSKVIQDYE